VFVTGCAVGAAAPTPSHACTTYDVADLLHVVDTTKRRFDDEPPSAPGAPRAEASRRLGAQCRDGVCVANSCGDSATVELRFEPSLDAASAASELGYRVELVSGHVPASMYDWLGVPLRSLGAIWLPTTFEEIQDLDATFQLVALDAAGNESPPSPSIAVQYQGCTKAPVGEDCEEVAGCSVAQAGSARSAGVPVLLASLMLLAWRGRRWRLARGWFSSQYIELGVDHPADPGCRRHPE
jgi:hypothetical protein